MCLLVGWPMQVLGPSFHCRSQPIRTSTVCGSLDSTVRSSLQRRKKVKSANWLFASVLPQLNFIRKDMTVSLKKYRCRSAPACPPFVCASCSAAPDPLQRRPGIGTEHCDPAKSLCGLSHSHPSESSPWPFRVKE